jgi:DNA-binding transcriptional regulator YiaG
VKSEMARISKYKNQFSEKSELLSKKFEQEAQTLTLDMIEELQFKYGISNVLLCETLKISTTVLSKWKTGERDLPDYYKVNIYCYFKYLGDN